MIEKELKKFPLKAEGHENYKKPGVSREFDGSPYASEDYSVQELVAGSHFLDPFVSLKVSDYEKLTECAHKLVWKEKELNKNKFVYLVIGTYCDVGSYDCIACYDNEEKAKKLLQKITREKEKFHKQYEMWIDSNCDDDMPTNEYIADHYQIIKQEVL